MQFTADRDYKPGEPLTAWCGPQPNSRLLIYYGEWEKGGGEGRGIAGEEGGAVHGRQ